MVFKAFQKCLKGCVAFVGGCMLGQIYYYFMLRDLLSPYNVGIVVAVVISITIGLLNAAAIQIRCISLLTFPMYLGKDGRRVLKALILTYVVAGPITNMSLNAREVVRVFACSNEMARNLSIARDVMIARPLRNTVATMGEEIERAADTLRNGLTRNLSIVRDVMIARPLRNTVATMGEEIERAADTLRYFHNVTAPIESEIESVGELYQSFALTRAADAVLHGNRSRNIERKYRILPQDHDAGIYHKQYLMKTEYRCHNLLSQAVLRCSQQMSRVSKAWQVELMMPTLPSLPSTACDVPRALGPDICDSRRQMAPGLGEAYVALKRAKKELMKGADEITIVNNFPSEYESYGKIQAVKLTGERVKQAFEEKFSVIQHAVTIINVCLALLFLRLPVAAQHYHDLFLTSIDFDNMYITELFKKIDRRRSRRNQYTLLPLKKMERYRYVDVYSLEYSAADRHRLLTQTLKVLLEVVTATTFVMLDRLFYEALDVVRKHAETEGEVGTRDLEMEVEGTGIVANTLRSMLSNLSASRVHGTTTNACLPQPRLMPTLFYLRIYGGYLWVLLLLWVNPHSMRLRRLICSYFYPRREKQRVLHLYNDILKKRIKLDATLRRKAVQAVRAHYLSGESLLLRFPNVLGWLRVLPAARMACLICGEVEPRDHTRSGWKACAMPKCPFLYCDECWLDVRERCLACDPGLAELSDQDSLSDDLPVY